MVSSYGGMTFSFYGKLLYESLDYEAMLDSDASTAKTLTLVAIILQVVFFVIGIFEVIAFAALFSFRSSVTTSTGTTVTSQGVPLSGLAIISIVFSFALLIGILWIALDYFLIYKKLKEERVREAETPSLVLGIIQLIFGGLIPGILIIVAYVKIRDSVRRGNGIHPGGR
jgi:heme/copper-type cytochrome/quinol oxidase subunit 2